MSECQFYLLFNNKSLFLFHLLNEFRSVLTISKSRQEIHNFKSKQFMAQTIFNLTSQQNKKNNVNWATLKQDLVRQKTNQYTSVSSIIRLNLLQIFKGALQKCCKAKLITKS
ncbi:unnamed protein product [Paramecium octaurelia]|uniref:Uncharacterized protein n=1 Tax=Paramecium octaurelia TaxID=43137 RepID=A0A8S1S3E4_PAROT|nr:unnamed protein product [Paramecium octaurelia]